MAKSSLTRATRQILRAVRLEDFARSAYHQLSRKGPREDWVFLQRYGNVDRHRVALRGRTTVFSTQDDYSKRWFYPRYDDGRIHEEPVTLLFLDELAESRCFVDVGANLGWFTCLAATHLPEGRVFSFEMDEQNFHLLEINVCLNRTDNVEIVHAAVSDQPGRVSYQRYGFRPSPEFRMVKDGADTGEPDLVSVDAVALDSFFAGRDLRPDFIKIDVEGAELQVLQGMSGLMRDQEPRLLIELHPGTLPLFGASAAEVVDLLVGSGYDVYEVEGLREQGRGNSLRRVSLPYTSMQNCMLYARVPGSGSPAAVS